VTLPPPVFFSLLTLPRAKEAEDKISELLQQLSDLSSSLTQKETLLSSERDKRLRSEQELQRQTILLERTQRELTTQTAKSSALRAEGRKARKEISQAAESLREVAGILQVSASHSVETNLRIGNDSLTLSLENIDTSFPSSSHHHGLGNSRTGHHAVIPSQDKDAGGDPLGIKEISTVAETIQSFTHLLRQIPQHQINLESTLRRYETENQRLQRELESIEVIHEDRLVRLENDNSSLEKQVQVLKNREMSKVEEARSVTQLAHENTLLRAKCDRADQKEKELLLEIASFTEQQQTTTTRSTTIISSSVGEQPQDKSVDQLTREVTALQQELDAVRHHRTVLQDSVSQLELLVYREADELSAAASQRYTSSSSAALSTERDLDQLALQVHRLERKQQSLDELIAVYRKGLLGLYADGSFYSVAQYTALKIAHGYPNTSSTTALPAAAAAHGGGWIEREIALIKRSYVVEIEALEKYCNSLSSRVRQGESYCSELRVRLEDTLRALYK
jgi:chromosome segregation ATPase